MIGDKDIQAYKFGELEFRVRGLGLFFPSEKLKARIAALSPDQLREANKAAWKLRRTAERLTERYSNVTLNGCGPYDRAFHDFDVARAVCNATWSCMARAA